MKRKIELLLAVLLVVVLLVGCKNTTPAVEEAANQAVAGEPDAADTASAAVAQAKPAAETNGTDTGAEESQAVIRSTTTESGLQVEILVEGSGEQAEAGDVVSVHYTGWLEDGTKFDSSVDRGEPIVFPLGQGRVIPGWDEGIALLTVGSKARLTIPPELAYGERGAGGGVIPPNATLIFEVELLDILPGSPDAPTEVSETDYTTTASGLQYVDLEVGNGATAASGSTVSVNYTGWLEDGTKFDSSLDRGQPFAFTLGAGQVIPGWDEGVAGMQVGGVRQLVIPPQLGYGEQGAGGIIPPNATLIFEVELLAVQ